jgi:hypothetical protein
LHTDAFKKATISTTCRPRLPVAFPVKSSRTHWLFSYENPFVVPPLGGFLKSPTKGELRTFHPFLGGATRHEGLSRNIGVHWRPSAVGEGFGFPQKEDVGFEQRYPVFLLAYTTRLWKGVFPCGLA